MRRPLPVLQLQVQPLRLLQQAVGPASAESQGPGPGVTRVLPSPLLSVLEGPLRRTRRSRFGMLHSHANV